MILLLSPTATRRKCYYYWWNHPQSHIFFFWLLMWAIRSTLPVQSVEVTGINTTNVVHHWKKVLTGNKWKSLVPIRTVMPQLMPQLCFGIWSSYDNHQLFWLIWFWLESLKGFHGDSHQDSQFNYHSQYVGQYRPRSDLEDLSWRSHRIEKHSRSHSNNNTMEVFLANLYYIHIIYIWYTYYIHIYTYRYIVHIQMITHAH